MKRTYKNLFSIALGGLLSLSLAFSANAQHRSNGGGGGGGARPSGGGGGGFSRPSGGGFSAPSRASVAPPQRQSFGIQQRQNGIAPQRQSINAAPIRPQNGFNADHRQTGNDANIIRQNGNRVGTFSTAPSRTGVRTNSYNTVGRNAYSGGRNTYYNNSRTAGYGRRVYPGGVGRPVYGGRGGYFGSHYYYPYHNYYNSYYLPRLGFSIGFLPFGYYPFYWGDYQYYYSDGLYYRQYNDQYTVVEPPVGAEIKKLPSDAKSISINGEQYYESNGVYYQPITKDDGTAAYVIAGKDGELNTDQGNGDYDQGPQVGDVVDQLPQDSRKVKINGQKLYESQDGFYYQETKDENGNTAYRVVGTPSDEPDDQQ